MKSVFAPHLNRHVKFGRKPRVAWGHGLKLGNYLRFGLPAAPSTFDFSSLAGPALRDVMQNDVLGDCTAAGAYHSLAIWTGNAPGGTAFHASPSQVLALYENFGYKPGDPSTDQGANEVDVLNVLQTKGFANGDRLLGHVMIDGGNKAEVLAAAWLFESPYFGVSLPEAWISPFPEKDGFRWDDGTPNEENGHCFVGYGATTDGLLIDSWGLFGLVTWKAIAHLCTPSAGGELHVAITSAMVGKAMQKAPNGVDWAALCVDFNAIGGHVPVPVPAPTPAPTPVPTPTPIPVPAAGVTLAQAQGQVGHDFGHGPFLLTRDMAATNAAASLAKLTGWAK